MLPTIEERVQQHKGTLAQCVYFHEGGTLGILFKKHVECGIPAPFPGRLGRIFLFFTCKTPGRKVCGLGFSFRTFHQGRSRATFGAHFEQKRERSYSPKRFSSSSLMIFNAFTRA